jgi:hypothetical protein
VKDAKSGGCEDTEIINDNDNCGAAGIEHLNSLPIECKKNLVDMGIFTPSVFLFSEVGELDNIYKVWHTQMAEQHPSESRPVSMITKGSARIHLIQMRKRLR